MNGLKINSNNYLFTDLNKLIDKYKPTHVVLDCDGTLYPNILKARRIFDDLLSKFLFNKFGYTKEEADKFISKNKIKFNTESEIGACILSGIDNEEFIENVIKLIPLDFLGIKDSLIWTNLLKYKLPLIIFTNNSSEFALRIVEKIGISENIKHIFGEIELRFLRKPDFKAYNVVSNFLGNNVRVIYFDDNENCLDSGKRSGWITVLTVFGDHLTNTTNADAVLKI